MEHVIIRKPVTTAKDRAWLRKESERDCCWYYHAHGPHRDDLCMVYLEDPDLCAWIGMKVKETSNG